MRKARNYKEEYQRRKLRKLRLAGKPAEKFDYVVRRVRAGDSVTEARKKVGLSYGAFRRQNEKQKVFETTAEHRPGKRRYVQKVFTLPIIDAKGGFHARVPFAGDNAKLVFAYRDAVERAERTGDAKHLKPFRHTTFIDADGNRVKPATDLNTLNYRKKALSAEQSERVVSKFYEIERLTP